MLQINTQLKPIDHHQRSKFISIREKLCTSIAKYESRHKKEVEVIIEFINEEFEKDWTRLPRIML